MSKYITSQEARQLFGFHPKTLNRWAIAGKIDFIEIKKESEKLDKEV